MKKLTIFMAVMLVAGSCAKYDDIDVVPMPTIADELVASFEEVDTKTFVGNDGKKLYWTAADEISYFPNINYNMQYRFKGATGDSNGTFQRITNDLVTGSELDTKTNYAFYPYAAETTISTAGVISYNFPATQTYAENSFGLGANAMVAVTNGADDNVLRFKNVGGYLQLKLYGTKTVLQSIKLEGKNSEKIAGLGAITATHEGVPTTQMAASATTSVTLDCGDGVTLSNNSENPTIFWFVLPTVKFTNGFTVTLTSNKGTVLLKSTNNSFTIERNTIQPMAAIETTIESTPIPASNEIWYTNGLTTEATAPYKTDVFGANIVSNTYDTEKGCWVITFDSDVTQIGNSAFESCTSLTSVTLPNSVQSIGNYVFKSCSGLTTLTIPNSVQSIGSDAFYNCSGLQSVTIGNSVQLIGDYAFKSCTNLTSVTIGNSVTSIGYEAFFECSKLASITIPDSVQSIGARTFYSCSSLQTITIPNSVQSIGNFAFYNCSKLASVYCKPTTPPTSGTQIFYGNAENRKIYVPASDDDSIIEAYKKATNWSSYATDMEEYEF